MAAEDQLRLLQSQALAEEEAAKRKGEIISRFLKDKLAKEKRSSALNLHKLNTQWRVVLRDTKDEELRRDVEVLSQTFARVMDCKDSVIESLATDLEEAQEQHARALRSHFHNVDRLLQLQRCRLTCLEEGYNAQLEALKTEFEAERMTILEQHEREIRYLRDVMLAMEQNYAINNHEATQNFQSAQADIKNKSLQEKQYCRTQLGIELDQRWDQFQQAMQNYAETTKQQKITFKVLMEKNKKSSREIKKQAKKLQKLQDLVTATKGRLVTQRRQSEEQNQRVREEKERILRQLHELMNEMNRARLKARGDLAKLSAQSGAALKMLERVEKKAQRVLRLGEMCRRMETEEEKVLPFYPSSLEEEEQQDAWRVLEEPPTEPLAQALRDYTGLERFWQRFSKAKLEEQALERAREDLRRRNQHLRELLRQYLAGISVSPEMFREPNPLLAIKRKSFIPKDSPHTGGDCAQGPQGAAAPQQPPGRGLPAGSCL